MQTASSLKDSVSFHTFFERFTLILKTSVRMNANFSIKSEQKAIVQHSEFYKKILQQRMAWNIYFINLYDQLLRHEITQFYNISIFFNASSNDMKFDFTGYE